MSAPTPDQQSDEVVLHVSDTAEDVARANAAATALTQADPQLRVRILVNGPALAGLTDSSSAITPSDGVTVEACSVGLQRRGMLDKPLQADVQAVESAVVAIVEAQRAGAAYVRL